MATGFQWDQGQLGGLGLEDLNRARQAGYSDPEIYQNWLRTGIPIGEPARAVLQQSLRNPIATPPPPAAAAPAPVAPAAPAAKDNSAELLAYQRELDTYRNQSSANSFKIADYESQLNRYKGDLETSMNQYKDVLGKYNESNSKISSLSQELEKVKADAELNRSNLDAYKKDTINQQLDVLRRGSGTGSGAVSGQADLTSGGTAVTRSPRRSGSVNVVANVDATDSVLDRKGPVVDVMGGGSAGPRADARQRAMAATSGGSAAGYYASRFG